MTCDPDWTGFWGLKKKDFRTALESEGYRIKNSSKHANQLRIFSEVAEM
jgi:hypothetical protein